MLALRCDWVLLSHLCHDMLISHEISRRRLDRWPGHVWWILAWSLDKQTHTHTYIYSISNMHTQKQHYLHRWMQPRAKRAGTCLCLCLCLDINNFVHVPATFISTSWRRMTPHTPHPVTGMLVTSNQRPVPDSRLRQQHLECSTQVYLRFLRPLLPMTFRLLKCKIYRCTAAAEWEADAHSSVCRTPAIGKRLAQKNNACCYRPSCCCCKWLYFGHFILLPWLDVVGCRLSAVGCRWSVGLAVAVIRLLVA